MDWVVSFALTVKLRIVITMIINLSIILKVGMMFLGGGIELPVPNLRKLCWLEEESHLE